MCFIEKKNQYDFFTTFYEGLTTIIWNLKTLAAIFRVLKLYYDPNKTIKLT